MFVALFELSQGPITWIYISETLPDKALGLAVLVNLLLTIVIGLVTSSMISALGGITFYIFAALAFLVSFCLFRF